MMQGGKTFCDLCGKKALYVVGRKHYCKDHRTDAVSHRTLYCYHALEREGIVHRRSSKVDRMIDATYKHHERKQGSKP